MSCSSFLRSNSITICKEDGYKYNRKEGIYYQEVKMTGKYLNYYREIIYEFFYKENKK